MMVSGLSFGKDGDKNLLRQIRQDKNTLMFGNAYLRDRVIFKISENYQNAHWDLVDAFRQDSLILKKLEPDNFPENMRSMSEDKKEFYLRQKQKERDLYKEGVTLYSEKAQELLKFSIGDTMSELTLDNSIIDTIVEQGKAHGFEFTE